MKRITIKDIANALNLHHSTVSRSLRNDQIVNKKTRERVLAYAREHGYQINRSALNLRENKSNVLGMVVPNVNHKFFSNIISEVANQAFESGYILSVFQSNESYNHEKQIVNALIQNNVAGVLASLSMETRDVAHFQQLLNLKIPLVLFDRVTDALNVTCIVSKNKDVVEQAVDVLVKKGYQRIAHITGIAEVNVFADRQAGYISGIEKNDLSYRRTVIVEPQFSVEEGRRNMQMLLQEREKPDALICDSSFLLLGAVSELKRSNMDTLANFGLVGFGCNDIADIVQPKIIDISQPEEKIASSAFEQLMNEINGEEVRKSNKMCFDAVINSIK